MTVSKQSPATDDDPKGDPKTIAANSTNMIIPSKQRLFSSEGTGTIVSPILM